MLSLSGLLCSQDTETEGGCAAWICNCSLRRNSRSEKTKSEAVTVSVTRTATTGAIPIPLCPAAESEPPGEQGQRCWPKPHPWCSCSNSLCWRIASLPCTKARGNSCCQPGGELGLVSRRSSLTWALVSRRSSLTQATAVSWSPLPMSRCTGRAEGPGVCPGGFLCCSGVPPSFHMGSNIVPSLAGLFLGSSHHSL